MNALLSDNGFVMPRWKRNVWCPGLFANVMTGGFAALTSWALYGGGAGIDLAQADTRTIISLRLPALAGAFFVGLAGAKWLTNEADKRLLTESIKVAGAKSLTPETCDELVQGSAMHVLENVEHA
jgi:hypothetical protein